MAVRLQRAPIGGSVTVNLGGESIVPLPRNVTYRALEISLTSQPTITGGNNTAAKTNRGDDWALIQSVSLIADGSRVLRQFSGLYLWWLNALGYRFAPRIQSTLGDGSTANPSLASTLRLPMALPTVDGPVSMSLDATGLTSLELRVQWGTWTSINADATGFTTAPTMTITGEYALDPIVDGSGNPVRFVRSEIFPVGQVATTGAATNVALDVPTRGAYTGFLINAVNGSGADAALLDRVQLVTTGTIFQTTSGRALRDMTDALSATWPTPRSAKSSREGWYFLNLLMPDPHYTGYFSESVGAVIRAADGSIRQLANLQLLFDVTAATTVSVYALGITL